MQRMGYKMQREKLRKITSSTELFVESKYLHLNFLFVSVSLEKIESDLSVNL